MWFSENLDKILKFLEFFIKKKLFRVNHLTSEFGPSMISQVFNHLISIREDIKKLLNVNKDCAEEEEVVLFSINDLLIILKNSHLIALQRFGFAWVPQPNLYITRILEVCFTKTQLKLGIVPGKKGVSESGRVALDPIRLILIKNISNFQIVND